MSSGDSSSESVRAAGQPMRGKTEKEDQPWESEETDRSSYRGPREGEGSASKSIREGEGRAAPRLGAQTQPRSGFLILCGSVFVPLLIRHLFQAGLQFPHVLQQLLQLGKNKQVLKSADTSLAACWAFTWWSPTRLARRVVLSPLPCASFPSVLLPCTKSVSKKGQGPLSAFVSSKRHWSLSQDFTKMIQNFEPPSFGIQGRTYGNR